MATVKALDRLKSKCSMEMKRYAVICPDGSEFEYWATPLSIFERRQAEKQAGPKADETAQALHILIAKAKEEDGTPMFNVGDFQDLCRELPQSVLTKIMVQLVIAGEADEDDAAEGFDPKPSASNSKKTKS